MKMALGREFICQFQELAPQTWVTEHLCKKNEKFTIAFELNFYQFLRFKYNGKSGDVSSYMKNLSNTMVLIQIRSFLFNSL